MRRHDPISATDAAGGPMFPLWAWGVLALLGLALRTPGMLQSLWLDEAFRTFAGLSGERARFLILHDVHNPLYNVVMYAWIRVFGDSEISIRLPSLAAAVGLVVLVARWAARAFGSSVGRWAAVWLIACPVHVWYSTEAKNNIFTVLFSTAAVMALERACRWRTWRWTLVAGLSGAAAVLTDFQSLLVLIPAWCLAGWLCARRQRAGGWAWGEGGRRLGPWALAILGTLCVLLPWAAFKAAQAPSLTRQYLGYFQWHEALRLVLLWFPAGQALPTLGAEGGGWWLRALFVAVVIVPVGVKGVGALWKSSAGWVVLVCIWAPIVLMFVSNEGLVLAGAKLRLYQPRNLLVVLPWYAVLMGAGMSALWARGGFVRRGLALSPLALGLGASILMRTLLADRETVITPNPDWRSLGAWLKREDGSGPPLATISNTLLLPLEYYAPGRELSVVPRDRDVVDWVRAWAGSHPGSDVVLVDDPFWAPSVPDSAWGQLDQVLERVSSLDVRSLHAVRYRPRAVQPAVPR